MFYLHYSPFHSQQQWAMLPAWTEAAVGGAVWRWCVEEAERLQALHGGLYHSGGGCLRSTLCREGWHVAHSCCAACALLWIEMAPSNGALARRIESRKRKSVEVIGKQTHRSLLSHDDLMHRVSEQTAGQRRKEKRIVRHETQQKAAVAAAFSEGASTAATQVSHTLVPAVLAQREAAARAMTACRRFAHQEAQLHSELAAATQRLAQAGGAHRAQVAALETQAVQCSQMVANCTVAYQQHLLAAHAAIDQQIREAKAEQISSMPEIIKCLYRADQVGRLEQFPEAAELITGMAKCLEHGSTKGRRLNATEEHFYGMLLNSGNPWVEQFVAKNLFGPSLSWAKQHRAALPTIPIGEVSEACVRLLHGLLCQYGLECVPGLVAEDGSTCARRVDWGDLLGDTEAEVWAHGVTLYGLSGNPIVVHSLEHLQGIFERRERPIANYVYVYTWVPVLPHAPHVPFCIVSTDNCFDADWVWRQWRTMHRLFKDYGLRLIGHVSDGDSRLRLCDFLLLLVSNKDDWCSSSKQIQHWLMEMFHTATTLEGHSLLPFQDWMHLLWRWRRQLLDPGKIWHVGPGLAAGQSFLAGAPHLNDKDLDYHEKQHWEGTQKIFSKQTVDYLMELIQEKGVDAARGTLAIVHIGKRLRDMWLAEEGSGWDPRMSIRWASEVQLHDTLVPKTLLQQL